MQPPPQSNTVPNDDRREWLRIDDRVLLEYRLLTDSEDETAPGSLPVTHQAIVEAIHKPTLDYFAQQGEQLAHSPLLPWMMKVDWLLEVIIKTLAQMHPGGVPIAQVADVNLSGGGISFVSQRQFAVGDKLSLKVVLPPFMPIQATALVIRSMPATERAGYDIATEFITLSPNDQEVLIRHILFTQAERIRAKRTSLSSLSI
ncbi:MAG: PilZ domain-containing protein [Nitrospira sp.]|nr:PilZ domain-containing protein [Nitrospira sp.]